jgi:hypothetical protein
MMLYDLRHRKLLFHTARRSRRIPF